MAQIKKGERNGQINKWGLNEREEMFCNLYVREFNGSGSVMEAGYSKHPSTARGIYAKLKARPEIQRRIQALKDERVERMKIDADYVLNRLIEIDNMDVMDILEDDMSVKPVPEWPKSWRRYLSGFKLEQLARAGNNQDDLLGTLKSIKWPDKVKNLELIGKHIGVGAWKETAAVNVNTLIETKSLSDIFQEMGGDDPSEAEDND